MSTKAEISPLQIIANQLNALKSTGPRTEAGKNAAKFNARRHGLTGQFYCLSQDDEKAYQTFEATMLATLRGEGAYELQLAITITQDHWRLNRSRAVEFNLYGRGHDELANIIDAPSESSHAAATMADTYRSEDRVFSNIALYETRIHRMIAKNEKRLNELKAERLAAEKLALEEAELLVRYADFLAAANVEPFIPGDAANDTIEVNGKHDNARLIPTEARVPDTIEVNGKRDNACLIPTEAVAPETIQVNGFVFSTAAIRQKIARDQRLANAQKCASLNWDHDRIAIQHLPEAA